METTDSTFEQDVLEKSKEISVLVDFWASWCGPCVMLAPILEKIAQNYKDKIIVAKLNVEENQQTASKYNIMSIPAVKLFKNGEVVDEFIGLRGEEDIKGWVDKHL